MKTKVLFLGTGNAFNTDGRGSQSIWIEPAGRAPFLVDLGPTALASMERSRVDPGRVDTVFITHLHGDHTAGWPFLLLHAAFVGRRTRPLRVHGPSGTRERLERLASAAYDDLVSGKKLSFPLEHVEIPVAKANGLPGGSGLRYDVVPVEHHPTSIGFRFHAGGATIGVTGDTRWCAGLEELGQGCDVLLLECTSLKKAAYPHVSLEELREGVSRLGSKRIVLVHLSDDVARALRRKPIRGVAAAEDGRILRI